MKIWLVVLTAAACLGGGVYVYLIEENPPEPVKAQHNFFHFNGVKDEGNPKF